VYNDSGEEQTCSASDKDTEETEDELECISSLQRLYTVFLPSHLKQQHPVSNWQSTNSNLTTVLGCRVRLLHLWKLRYPNSLYIYSKTLFKLTEHHRSLQKQQTAILRSMFQFLMFKISNFGFSPICSIGNFLCM
jgi:hypothetical protein